MPSDQLLLNIIQHDIAWEDKAANLAYYERCLDNLEDRRELILLPEMFSTGFSMNVTALAEPMDGPTVEWMRAMAVRYRCIIAGSLIVEEEGKYYNRLVWMQPSGQYGVYDKRHLFGLGREPEFFSPGASRLIASVNGWKICVLVCYDLRFPVWSRNAREDYDVLVYLANWPEARAKAWKTLLEARAIENQCYTIGVNRVGTDGNGLYYGGDSSVFGPLGELLWQHHGEPACKSLSLSRQPLDDTRAELPFLKDADRFLML